MEMELLKEKGGGGKKNMENLFSQRETSMVRRSNRKRKVGEQTLRRI